MPLPSSVDFLGNLSGLTSGLTAPAASLTPQDRAALTAQVLQQPQPPNPRTPLEGVFDALNQGLRGRMMAQALQSKETATKNQAATIADMLYGKAPQTGVWMNKGAQVGDPNAQNRATLTNLITQGVIDPSAVGGALLPRLGLGGQRPMTPQEKQYWGIAPNVPAVMDLATNTPKILSSSVNTFDFGGGQGGPDTASGGRFVQNPDGTQTDQATGKVSAKPIGNNPGAIGADNWPAPDDPSYATAPIAGGLTAAAIDQRALNNLATGQLPPSGRGTTGPVAEQNIAVANRMAAIGGNTALNRADYKSLGTALTQQTTYLNNVQRSFNTAQTTLQSVIDWMNQNNIDPSQFPDLNSLSNWAAARGIDVGPIRGFQSQIAQLRAEYAQVLARGGQQTDTVRNEANDIVPDNIGPKDLAIVAQRLNIDAKNAIDAATQQVAAIRQQIAGTGGSTNPAPVSSTGVGNTDGPTILPDGTKVY